MVGSFVLLMVIVCGAVLQAEENLDHAGKAPHEVDGEHNPEYDHEAIIGSRKEHEEFEQLPIEESKRRLEKIVDEMDSDGNGEISQEELVNWVLNSFTKLDLEEAEENFKNLDENADSKLTLNEYSKSTYGYTVDETIDWEKDNNEEMREINKLVKQDAEKFLLADLNADGSLTLEEFNAFQHPWDHERMHVVEIQETLDQHDKNRDGSIDLEEFLGNEVINEEDQLVEKENFKAFDKNDDGVLDVEEVKDWVIPSYTETATDEAEHLMQETDADSNGILTKAEILEKYELWVGSAALDYGEQINSFHDPSEL